MRTVRPTRSFLILLVALAGLAAAPASGAMGKIQGIVSDGNGDPLPGVVVSASGPALGDRTVDAITDALGRYALEPLPPGKGYTLTAAIPGYARVEAGPLEVTGAAPLVLPLTLSPSADLEETVRVEARGNIVDLVDTSVETTFNEEFVETLPLVGRQIEDLLILAPGVSDPDKDGRLNVRGARDTSFQLRLDGTNVTDPLTGYQAQEINLETIEAVEIITAGASAEYGRADGGFAEVITKSGGNDFEGSFKYFFRSDYFDGDPAGASPNEEEPFRDTKAFLTIGGPIVRDRAWYFASVERLQEETPFVFTDGSSTLTKRDGWSAFAKLTFQLDTDNKLRLQVSHDPLEYERNHLGEHIALETDYDLRTRTSLPQMTWTAVLSPRLLFQATLSRLDGTLEIDPVSGSFREVKVQRITLPDGTASFLIPPGGFRALREISEFPVNEKLLRFESGPYSERSTTTIERVTEKSDLTYTLENGSGEHRIKTGFELNFEGYKESGIVNPILYNHRIEVYEPNRPERRADGVATGIYVQDSWKPLPQLAVSAGLRFDHERITSLGLQDFDPLEESREALRRFVLWCDAAGTPCTSSLVPGRRIGRLPARIQPPPGHPALEFDLNGDGFLDTAAPEGNQILEPFTTVSERTPDSIDITNGNLAPRLSVSWDPWADGRTKVYASYGVYYDRIFLGAVTAEQEPQALTARFSGNRSFPLQAVSIGQVDRDLRTPYTVEWTTGVEREIAPEWAVALTYISRRGEDLLQDLDANHITCAQFDSAYGVDPFAVCGDGGVLETDRFGAVASGPQGTFNVRNGAVDLYNLNPNYNKVLRVSNSNASDYDAWEIRLRKRLHRNWQMQFSYTYSKARGEAESFTSVDGNDAAINSDKVAGYLDFDERHVIKWQGVTHLPHGLLLGGSIEWGSGLPYTLIRVVEDLDDLGNLTLNRLFPVTGKKNDQRNESQLAVNGRIEKRLSIPGVEASGFLEVENLLDEDDLVFRLVEQGDVEFVDGYQRLGRRWQIGVSVHF